MTIGSVSRHCDSYSGVSVLTREGIIAKHRISSAEFEKTRQKLLGMRLRDILFHYPDGKCYDIALHLVATSR